MLALFVHECGEQVHQTSISSSMTSRSGRLRPLNPPLTTCSPMLRRTSASSSSPVRTGLLDGRMRLRDDVGLLGVDLLRSIASRRRGTRRAAGRQTPAQHSAACSSSQRDGRRASSSRLSPSSARFDSVEATSPTLGSERTFIYLAEEVYQRETPRPVSSCAHLLPRYITAELANRIVGIEDAHLYLTPSTMRVHIRDGEQGATAIQPVPGLSAAEAPAGRGRACVP